MEQLTFWSGGLPAKTSLSPEREPDFLESAVDWPSTLSAWLVKSHRDGCFGKTFPDACPRTPGSTSVPLPKRWLTAGKNRRQNSHAQGVGTPFRFPRRLHACPLQGKTRCRQSAVQSSRKQHSRSRYAVDRRKDTEMGEHVC